MPFAAGASDPDYEQEMPPKKKRRRGDASSAPSETSSVLANAAEDQMTAAHLLEAYDDPWAYSQKQLDIIEECSSAELALVADELWVRTSWQITARRSVEAVSGLGELVERCAVTHQEGGGIKFESAHLVSTRRKTLPGGTVSRGQQDIDLLRQVQVVPERAHVNMQANRLHLAYDIHRDIDDHLLDLFPHGGQVIARLVSETKYQEERLAASSSGTASEAPAKLPARPPFKLFYAAAEKDGACFRLIASNRKERSTLLRANQDGLHTDFALEGIVPDDPLRLILFGAKIPPPDMPILPALVAPVSMNLLIWAMCDRLRRSPPFPSGLRQEYSTTAQLVDLLLEFWFINDKTPVADIAGLQLSKLGTVDYADIIKAVTLPENVIRSQDPPPTPEERALMLEAAAALDDVESMSGSASGFDLPPLDFPDPHLPLQLASVPSHPLTTAALHSFEMQQLRDSGKLTSVPGSGEKSSTPSLSPPTSSSISTCSPSLPAPVLDAIAVPAHPGKLSLVSSFATSGPYPFEATGPHSV